MSATAALRQQLGTALGLLQRGQTERARSVLEEILIGYPGQPHASSLLARIYRQAGDLERAGATLASVGAEGAHQPALVAERAYLAMVEERHAEARQAFENLVSLRPDHADAWFNLGQASKFCHDLPRAVEAWQRALTLGVAQPAEAHVEIGSALTILRREREAEAAFREALALNPDDARAVYGLGVVHAAFGDFEAALTAFRRALSLDPGMVEAHQQLVACRRFESLDDPEIRVIENLLSGSEPDADARQTLQFALGKAYDDAGAWDLAFANYSAANRQHGRRHGRWDPGVYFERIERILDRFPRLAGTADAGGGDEVPRPVFIVGLPRSGTTLLERVVCSHPDLAPAGELAFFEGVARSSLNDYRLGPEAVDAGKLQSEYVGELARFGQGSAKVTDKYPGNFLHLGLIQTVFPGVRVIHCRRNPLDTGLSIYFQDFATGNPYAFDLADIGRYIAGYQQVMAHWDSLLGDQLLHVDYEELVKDKADVTRRVWQFLSLPEADPEADHRGGDDAVATLSRWQARQPVYGSSVERWRHYEAHLGPLRDAIEAAARTSS